MNYQISINDFEGPFDLLLHLVKETKMDIYEINMGIIIEDYLKYIHSLQELNINVASEFLIMASELIHLKSKMLIGKSLEEEKEDSEYSILSEEDLKNRIMEYQKYKEITKTLKKMEEKRGTIYTKVPESLKEYIEEPKLVNEGLGVEDLLQAFLNLQERIHYKEPVTTKITRKEISVESRRNRINHVLKEKGKVTFEELFEVYTKEFVVVTFMALLDMTKNHEVIIEQSDNFDKIWIEKSLEEV